MYNTTLLDGLDRIKRDILSRKEEHKRSPECIGINCPICSSFDKEYNVERERQAQFFKEDSGWN